MIRPQRGNPILRRTSEIMPVRELREHHTEIAETVEDRGRARPVEFGAGVGCRPAGPGLHARMPTLGRWAMIWPNQGAMSMRPAAPSPAGTIVALAGIEQAGASRRWPFAAPRPS